MSLKNLLFAFGIGLSVGAGFALLYAPQSGEATRKKLRRSAEDAGDYLEDTAEYLKDQAERLANEAKNYVERARTSVDAAVDQASSVVSSTLKSAQKLV